MDVDQLSAPEKQTALHIACAKNLTDIASYLISVNASLKICDKEGKMPYDLCSSVDLKRLVKQALTKNNLKNGLIDEANFENDRHIKQAKENKHGVIQNRENGSSGCNFHQGTHNKCQLTEIIQGQDLVLKKENLDSKIIDLDTKNIDNTEDNNNDINNNIIKRIESGRPPIDLSGRTSKRPSLIATPDKVRRIQPPRRLSVSTLGSLSFDLDDFDFETIRHVDNRKNSIENVTMNDFEEDEENE